MKIRISGIIMAIAAMLLLSVTFAAAEQKKQEREITKLELRISSDGKAIVDQNNKEVARFVEGTQVQTVTKKDQKLQGCMRCWNECLAYEGTRCVKWVRTCQWDFDCK